jgi:16S rRNA (cytosine1402-N4)-methyltransferase
MSEFQHIPVLLEETLDGLLPRKNGVYVDCTFGGGGHTGKLLDRLEGHCSVIAIDQDPVAIENGKEQLNKYCKSITFVNSNFKDIKTVAHNLNINEVDGIFFDLGVSSYQLDTAERGFSYQQDAPLDMRMDTSGETNAFDIVNSYSHGELHRIIKEYGEEKWAHRIATYIVEAREKKPIKTTGELVDIIKAAVPASARREGPHPAKRTFQAIRIEVNKELEILSDAIIDSISLIKPGGRLSIITFHSLEDRIVKDVYKELSTKCKCPPEFPLCICNNTPAIRMVNKKPIVPSNWELENNPRSRSAKLRIAEKIQSTDKAR